MTNRKRAVLNATLALIVSVIMGSIPLFFTAMLYIAASAIVWTLLHREITNPSTINGLILYGIYIAAIGIPIYRWLEGRSRECVTE